MKLENLKNTIKELFEDILSEKEISSNVLNATVKNPETGRSIKVKSALGYDHSHPAYKAAKSAISKNGGDANVDKKSKGKQRDWTKDPYKNFEKFDAVKPEGLASAEDADDYYIGHPEGDFDREILAGYPSDVMKSMGDLGQGYPNKVSSNWQSAVNGKDFDKFSDEQKSTALKAVGGALSSGDLIKVTQVMSNFVSNNEDTYVAGAPRDKKGKLTDESKEHLKKIVNAAGGSDKVKQIAKNNYVEADRMIQSVKNGTLDLIGDREDIEKSDVIKDLKRIKKDAFKFLNEVERVMPGTQADQEATKQASDKKAAEKSASVEQSKKQAEENKKSPAKPTKELDANSAMKIGFGSQTQSLGEKMINNVPKVTSKLNGKEVNAVDVMLQYNNNARDFDDLPKEDQEMALATTTNALHSGEFDKIQPFFMEGGPRKEFEAEGLNRLVSAAGGPDKLKNIAKNHAKSLNSMIEKAKSGDLSLHSDPNAEQINPPDDGSWDAEFDSKAEKLAFFKEFPENAPGQPNGKTNQQAAIRDLEDMARDTMDFISNMEKNFPSKDEQNEGYIKLKDLIKVI